jgi:hypothetical protein
MNIFEKFWEFIRSYCKFIIIHLIIGGIENVFVFSLLVFVGTLLNWQSNYDDDTYIILQILIMTIATIL